jgi:hypothetical protein
MLDRFAETSPEKSSIASAFIALLDGCSPMTLTATVEGTRKPTCLVARFSKYRLKLPQQVSEALDRQKALNGRNKGFSRCSN